MWLRLVCLFICGRLVVVFMSFFEMCFCGSRCSQDPVIRFSLVFVLLCPLFVLVLFVV